MSLDDFSAHFCERFPGLKSQAVLVALSGGADSVALLHLLAEPELRLRLAAAYVDHKHRPAEVIHEIEFCQNLCDKLKIPFHKVDIKPSSLIRNGQEADWRQQRYEALNHLAKELGTDIIATAHHRDDVAEGVLVQLLRGAGPRALAGIHERTESGVIRPLLPFDRCDIITYLKQKHIVWCEDSSNRDTSHLRNRIRHDILPQLEEVSPGMRAHLVNLARALSEDENLIRAELEDRAQWIDPWSPDGGVHLDTIREFPPALSTRWLHAQAARIGINRVSRAQLELFASMLRFNKPRSLSLEKRWRLRIVGGCFWLEPPQELPRINSLLEGHKEIELPIPGWRIALRKEHTPITPGAWFWHPPEAGRLEVRTCRRGETIIKTGRPVKTSTLLAQNLPRHLRNAWPAVTVDGTICWIPGVWRGPATKVPQTQRVEVFRR